MNGVADPGGIGTAFSAAFVQPGYLVKPEDGLVWRLVIGRHWSHCVITWPVVEQTYGGQGCWVPQVPPPDYSYLMPIFNLRDWQVQELTWLSPVHYGIKAAGAPPGILGVPKTKVEGGQAGCCPEGILEPTCLLSEGFG